MPAVEPRYAEALLSLADDSEQADKIGESLEAIKAAMDSSGELRIFFMNPVIPKAKKRDAVKRLLTEDTLKPAENFLYLLIDKNRLKGLPRIIEEYNIKKASRYGVLFVTVTSAHPLEKGQLDEISDLYLKKTKAKRAEVQNLVDASVLGGLRIQAGGFMTDDTISGRLDRIKSAIHTMNQ